MANVEWGLFTVLLCTCGYGVAFFKQGKNEYGYALTLLVFCGLALRIFASADLFLHEWDERYHALVAKHLMAHFLKPTLYENPILPYAYNEWTSNYIWVHKQPLPLWLMAISLKVFGLHAWAVRVPSILLSTIGIKLIYDIGKYMYDRKVAFIAAFLFSIHGLIIEITSGRQPTDHVDLAFMFFILLAVWLATKHAQSGKSFYPLFIGMSIGAAIMCKWLPALIVIPIWLSLVYKQNTGKKTLFQLATMMAACTLVALPWQFYIIKHFPTEAWGEYHYNTMHMHSVLGGQGGNFFFYFDALRMHFGELIYLPVLWFSFKKVKRPTPHATAILVWFWVPYLFFSFCATKMAGYTLFAAPAVFLITAHMYVELRQGSNTLPRPLVLIVCWGLILLPVRYSIERLKPFTVLDRDPAWNVAIEQFAKTPANSPKTVVFNCEHYIEMMFLTSCTCYDKMPDGATISKLRLEGYSLYVQKGEMFAPL